MKYLSLFTLFALLTIWAGLAFGGSYHHNTTNNTTINNYAENVTFVTNTTGVSRKDLATIGAMSGAASGHQFTLSTKSLQWSVSGACVDSSSDDCGVSGALSKRVGSALLTGIVSGASDDRLLVISVGGTF